MRKPRDFDQALKSLTEKTKALKETKRRQLGDLIVATGADALDVETLAGGLLAIVKTADVAQKEVWRKQGQAFFRKAPAAESRSSVQPERDAQAGSRPPQARSGTGEA
jgi:DNA-binding protein H-NS